MACTDIKAMPSQRCVATTAGDTAVTTTAGERSNVLLLHGNSSCKEVFASQIAALQSAGFATAAADLPGHGASCDASAPATTYSFPGYADVMRQVVTVLGWPTYAVLGWSLGGHVALELLAQDPRVRACLIVGTPPANPSPEALQDAFCATPDMMLAGKRNFSRDDALTYGRQMLGGDSYLTPHLLQRIERTDGRAREHMFSNGLAGIGVKAKDLVATSPVPLCVVHGSHDPFVRLSYLQSISYRTLWRGRVQIIEEAGHAPHWQNPETFNTLMLEFLTDVACN